MKSKFKPPKTIDNYNLEQNFPYFSSFDENLQEDLRTLLQKNIVAKGTLLLREGSFCKKIYFLAKGLVRGFYYREGKELTSWFGLENDALTSLSAFIQQKTSKENIEILEDSILYSLTYTQLQELYEKYPEFNRSGRMLIEKYYIELEEHTLSLQFDSATERYQKLLYQQNHLLQRVPLKYIASYLGISQETLSRIRAKNL